MTPICLTPLKASWSSGKRFLPPLTIYYSREKQKTVRNRSKKKEKTQSQQLAGSSAGWGRKSGTSSWPARETFSLLNTEVSKSSEGMAAPTEAVVVGAATMAATARRRAAERTHAGCEAGKATEEAVGVGSVLGTAAAAARVLGWEKEMVEAAIVLSLLGLRSAVLLLFTAVVGSNGLSARGAAWMDLYDYHRRPMRRDLDGCDSIRSRRVTCTGAAVARAPLPRSTQTVSFLLVQYLFWQRLQLATAAAHGDPRALASFFNAACCLSRLCRLSCR